MTDTRCEWCGEKESPEYYKVTLPGDCCSYFICLKCVVNGERSGGGTAFCAKCSAIIPRKGSRQVTEWWKRKWHRKVKITKYVCNPGCYRDA
jgi:hypothetical protein